MNLMERYIKDITGKFKGQTVHVVGSGPSLVGFDYSYFSDKTCIVVNSAFKFFKEAGVDYAGHVFLDRRFLTEVIKKDYARLEKIYTSFKIARWLNIEGVENDFISFVHSEKPILTPGPVFHMNSSLATAVTIALQGGAKEVLVYGSDGKFLSKKDYLKAAKRNGASKEIISQIKDSEHEFFSHNIPERCVPLKHEPYFQVNAERLAAFPKDKVKIVTDLYFKSQDEEEENENGGNN